MIVYVDCTKDKCPLCIHGNRPMDSKHEVIVPETALTEEQIEDLRRAWDDTRPG